MTQLQHRLHNPTTSNSIVDRYLRQSDIAADSTWALLRWLMSRGADEISVVMISLQGIGAPHLDSLDQRLAPYALASQRREHLTGPTRKDLFRLTPLWSLNDNTEAILREIFKAGLFEYPAYEAPGGWVEQPTVYRHGELVLSIISHELEGMLRLAEEEFVAFDQELGIRVHEAGEWI